MKITDIKSLSMNPFTKIGSEWMLITAGSQAAHNTMTASWGAVGVMWNKPAATCYIRPQRHTLGFMEENDTYSLCFFDESYRDALTLCGRVSGRDTDKDAAAGLTCAFYEGTPYYEEASLVLICRKMYGQYLSKDGFLSESLYNANYPADDLHKMFIGEIVAVLEK